MQKRFISADELLRDSFLLARKIVDSGYQPSFIIGVWRGGAPIAIAVQEYLSYIGIETDHIAIRTTSYTGIAQQQQTVRLAAMEYAIEHLKPTDRVLLVDDVFDSGKSMAAIRLELESKLGNSQPSNLRIACPWYKPNCNQTFIAPDYYLHETKQWLVFPHELRGLDKAEIQHRRPMLADALDGYWPE